jgi:beta-glucosidase
MNKNYPLLVSAFLLCTMPMVAQPKLNKNNIDEVLKAMTLEEKATLVVCCGSEKNANTAITGQYVHHIPGSASQTQAIPRLGITETVLADGPVGLRIDPTREGDSKTYYCTKFPGGIGMSASWNPDAVNKMCKVIGSETKDRGVDVLLAPGMNLLRNPLNGRNFEYFSEDPVLSGKISAAYVKGIQSQGVGVSVKHFVANNQETNRLDNDTQVSVRALRELYLKGFEICVKEAEPWTMMSSYNRLNGPYTQESRDLLTTILRDEWGYKGIVMTDWTGRRNTVQQLFAGNELFAPGMPIQTQDIIDGVKNGQLKESDLDISVRRILEYVVKTPRFAGYKYTDNPDLKAHGQVARESAVEGMVLLKNSTALPLSAQAKVALYGNCSYELITGGSGAAQVYTPYVVNINEGLTSAGFTLDKNLVDYYSKYIPYKRAEQDYEELSHVHVGKAIIPELVLSRKLIDKQAAVNDVAVLTLGRNSGEARDRNIDGDFNLTDAEFTLLRNICDSYHAQGKKVVVVLNICGVVETASWKSLPDAILVAWQPGEEGGNSVADILSGKVSPSGKLPMTFPISYMDDPTAKNFPYDFVNDKANNSHIFLDKPAKNITYTKYEEGIWVGYRYFTTFGVPVSYPFGFGLSYTTFSYSKPSVKVASGKTVTATVTVTNTGKVAGKEVVELYVSAPGAGVPAAANYIKDTTDKPVRELKAFAKTRLLQPGESQTITMDLDTYSLASYNESAGQWETTAGTYTFDFASSVDDVRAKATTKLAKDSWPVHASALAPQK